jgi:hypothetical protein
MRFGNANQDENATGIVAVICKGAQRMQHGQRMKSSFELERSIQLSTYSTVP